MKILIATDMEGISGIVNWNQVNPENSEYGRWRHVMTADVNAAIRGAMEAGATEIVVTDGHWFGTNILIEELDSHARLNSGLSGPLAMVQGVDASFNAAFFVGYHARSGTPNAIMDHTWSGSRVRNVYLNDTPAGETRLNAAVCGHFGVPLIMLTGDQAVTKEVSELIPGVEVATVKQASGRMSAECLPLLVSQEKICEAAARAVQKLAEGKAPPAYKVQPPVRIRVELGNTEMTDKADKFPWLTRLDGRTVEFSAEDMLSAYRIFQAIIDLAQTSR